MAFAKSASVGVTTWGSSFKKRLLPRSVHWKEGGRYSCIALANASSNSPSLYHKNLHVFECCGVLQRISMIHFDSGGSLNGTSHSFTFEEDTLLEGKAWESIKFSHISKAGPNRQCTRLCVRVDFDSIKVSLSKNSVSSIWISSCRGFATFFGRTPTSTKPPLSSIPRYGCCHHWRRHMAYHWHGRSLDGTWGDRCYWYWCGRGNWHRHRYRHLSDV